MSRHHIWILGKALEGVGLVVVLVGLVLSVELGMRDEGMTSQYAELVALGAGLLLFGLGLVLERSSGHR